MDEQAKEIAKKIMKGKHADVRKEMTEQKVKAKLQLDLQVRRQILNLLQNVDNGEKSIKLQIEHVIDMKAQLASGNITQRDKFGNILNKTELPRTITTYEMNIKDMELQNNYFKEDLFHAINVRESSLHGRSLEEIKTYLKNHYDLMNSEYEKIKKILGG